jgi:DNA-directed RNA polymerase specialized sigma24 family protein
MVVLPRVLGSDYLVRFQKRLPRDLQAKYDAADVVHDAFLLACRDLQQFHGATDEKLCQWLHSACRHRRQNLARAYRQRRKRQVGREVSLDDACPSDGHASEPVAPTLNPTDQAIQHEEEKHARSLRPLERARPEDSLSEAG